MVRIRLRRVGLKKQPSYRIIVADQRSPRDGRFIEIIGQYNPRTRPNTAIVDEARALYWLGTGAQPTETVQKILVQTGTWARFERMRKGETVEALVAEAEAAQASAEPVSPKTKYPSPAPGKSKQKAAEMAAVEETEPEAEEAES
ncbi:MAG: 30S ribosomal protein S16 [Anaerolineaceae bacterium]|nr:30S ribosomal protein S16 [Anaerolineaceae bacterium]